ncbi:uncharacterized protein ACIQIH_009890 isoform 1-T1 [Cyanocitta cristata]
MLKAFERGKPPKLVKWQNTISRGSSVGKSGTADVVCHLVHQMMACCCSRHLSNGQWDDETNTCWFAVCIICTMLADGALHSSARSELFSGHDQLQNDINGKIA